MELLKDFVGGTWGPGHSSLAPSVLTVPLGFPGLSEWGSAPQPLRAGALMSPKGLMVGLSAWEPSLESLSHLGSLGKWA